MIGLIFFMEYSNKPSSRRALYFASGMQCTASSCKWMFIQHSGFGFSFQTTSKDFLI